MLVAPIVSCTGVPFRVLVAHGRSQSVKDSTGSEILRGDQNNGLFLPLNFESLDNSAVFERYVPAWYTMISATSGSVSASDFSSIYTLISL